MISRGGHDTTEANVILTMRRNTIFVEMHFLIYLSESFLYHLTFLGPVIKTMKDISLKKSQSP